LVGALGFEDLVGQAKELDVRTGVGAYAREWREKKEKKEAMKLQSKNGGKMQNQTTAVQKSKRPAEQVEEQVVKKPKMEDEKIVDEPVAQTPAIAI